MLFRRLRYNRESQLVVILPGGRFHVPLSHALHRPERFDVPHAVFIAAFLFRPLVFGEAEASSVFQEPSLRHYRDVPESARFLLLDPVEGRRFDLIPEIVVVDLFGVVARLAVRRDDFALGDELVDFVSDEGEVHAVPQGVLPVVRGHGGDGGGRGRTEGLVQSAGGAAFAPVVAPLAQRDRRGSEAIVLRANPQYLQRRMLCIS